MDRNAPGGIRTPDLEIRNLALYPPELPGLGLSVVIYHPAGLFSTAGGILKFFPINGREKRICRNREN